MDDHVDGDYDDDDNDDKYMIVHYTHIIYALVHPCIDRTRTRR